MSSKLLSGTKATEPNLVSNSYMTLTQPSPALSRVRSNSLSMKGLHEESFSLGFRMPSTFRQLRWSCCACFTFVDTLTPGRPHSVCLSNEFRASRKLAGAGYQAGAHDRAPSNAVGTLIESRRNGDRISPENATTACVERTTDNSVPVPVTESVLVPVSAPVSAPVSVPGSADTGTGN